MSSERIQRTESRHSIRSRISRIQNTLSHRSNTEERLTPVQIPVTNIDTGVIGWDSQDDPKMPLNFPPWKKWLLLGLLSSITFVTPFASSILSPGIKSVNEEFGNTDQIIGSMTVSIYLLGYAVGPLFMAPLCEIYGRKPILGAANIFFCVWQIGCALAPNMATLILFRFFAGVGGAGCMVGFFIYKRALDMAGKLLTVYRPWVVVSLVISSALINEGWLWVSGWLDRSLVRPSNYSITRSARADDCRSYRWSTCWRFYN